MAEPGAGIEEINVVLDVENLGRRKIAAIRLGRRDASIYVFPFCGGRRYFYGSSSMAEKQTTATFDVSEQETSFEKPHLSIHESGAVQVTLNRGTRAGPVQITPLSQAPTGHLATVRADTIKGLREHSEPLRTDGKTIDWKVTVPADVRSCKLVLFLRRDGERIPAGSAFVYLRSPILSEPLALCLEVREDEPIGDGHRDGVTVIAGWDPTPNLPDPPPAIQFVYLRAD
jgi:hypothetical protein